jgi:fructose-1,6-bisphosphatase/inositol monophosphatase family enzyme
MDPWGDDLAFAFVLADAADAMSLQHFRSEDMRRTHKVDGTPVAQVDFDVEDAMLGIVRAERPDDAVIGEEIGPSAGRSGRRWIFDGIDGTHNFAMGRPGWGTQIALEVDDEIVVGVVSCPRFGRRVWATCGGGAWQAPDADGVVDPSAATRMRCSTASSLDDAVVGVMPWEGFLVGWRDEIPRRFPPPPAPRSESIVLDAVAAAAGEFDVAILHFGALWDFTATSLIITEAGGVFRDIWGGTSFDTQSGIFTNAALMDEVLAVLGGMRPAEPDRAILTRTVSSPVGTEEEQLADGWRKFGIRAMPSMSARVHVENAPPEIMNIVDERAPEIERPMFGVTTDGVLRTGLRSLGDAHVDTRPITDAALAFLQALTPEQRSRASFAIDAIEWRTWLNVHMNHFHHGMILEELGPTERELGLDILRATLSVRGFHQARSIMRINELVAQLTGDYSAFGEWPYFVSIFGNPEGDDPWGWQIDGHHLCVNTMVFDGRIVMTPTFMGSEPRRIHRGPLAGLSLFDPEEATGLTLMRALDTDQRAKALIHPSIHTDDISPQLQNMFDGRMQAGAFHDNLVAPYQGVAGSELSDGQRRMLLEIAASYAGWAGDRHAEVQMHEVVANLDETWFSWYGGFDDELPFYYRVHSPVIMIEFDHHPGVVFDNETPTRHHVHSLVRTPNGGDYGADLLRAHHARFDHSHGSHVPRD